MKELINKHAIAHGVRPDIVACIILQESEGNTFAWRWEEGFYHRNLKGKKRSELSGWKPPSDSLPSLEDECLQRSCSFGAMQVLGETARWCCNSTLPYLTALCDPDIGIDYGCKVLAFYLRKNGGSYERALAAYNAGNPDYPAGKEYCQKIFRRIQNKEHLKILRD